MSEKLSCAIELLCAVSARDLAKLKAVALPTKQCFDVAIFCDAVVRYGVVDGGQLFLSHRTAQNHHRLCSLLNLVLRRAVHPVLDEICGVVPSAAFGRAVVHALITLGPARSGVDATQIATSRQAR